MNHEPPMSASKEKIIVAPTGWLGSLQHGSFGWAAVLSLAFLFAFGQTFTVMAHQWSSESMYSYGFLIPVISAYMIWMRRDELKPLSPSPHHLAGFGMLSFSVMLMLAGQAGGLL